LHGNDGDGVDGHLRVLIVEDHPDTAEVLARILSSSGHVVKTAHTVASALELAAQEPFEVIVSDIGLPDATGYELMRQLKARYAVKGIAMSGYGTDEDIRKSQEAGFSDHIVKPANIGELERAIRRVARDA
jgi:CheY-like chemotaxis protein